MGTLIPAGRDAPLKLAEALQNGQHVAMLVDQYLTNGVEVTFFGRKTRANPMLARLLRQVDCPIHGARIIRLPGNRFRAELSEEVKPVRDAAGQIDVQGTMQAITVGRRRLDPRISGTMAVAASAVAVSGDGNKQRRLFAYGHMRTAIRRYGDTDRLQSARAMIAPAALVRRSGRGTGNAKQDNSACGGQRRCFGQFPEIASKVSRIRSSRAAHAALRDRCCLAQ